MASLVEKIRAFAWLVMLLMLIVELSKDFIEPELSRLAAVREISLMLCKFPELVINSVAEIVRLFELRTSPKLAKFLPVAVKFTKEESSPLFSKLALRVKISDSASEAIAAFSLFVRLVAVRLRAPLARILFVLVTSPAVKIVKLFKAEISPALINEPVVLRIKFAPEEINPEFVSKPVKATE